jgi:hypothetical protein
MLIRVTRDHINRGERDSPDRCAVVLAIRAALQETDSPDALVTVTHLCIVIGNASWPTPPDVLRFINLFEAGVPRGSLQPFEFDLPLENANV